MESIQRAIRAYTMNLVDALFHIGGMALAALVAYFTTMKAVAINITKVSTKQQENFNEILRRLDSQDKDMRELRRALMGRQH